MRFLRNKEDEILSIAPGGKNQIDIWHTCTTIVRANDKPPCVGGTRRRSIVYFWSDLAHRYTPHGPDCFWRGLNPSFPYSVATSTGFVSPGAVD